MTKRTMRALISEYRPSMDADVLHSWATELVATWQGDAPERVGADDFEERMFMQGFGFVLAHIARDMSDNHYAQMIADQNSVDLSELTDVGLDSYDLNAIKVALTSVTYNEEGDRVQICPDCGEPTVALLEHLQTVHGDAE